MPHLIVKREMCHTYKHCFIAEKIEVKSTCFMFTHATHYFGYAFQLARATLGGMRGRDKMLQCDRHCVTWSDPIAMHGTSSAC
jgi:hypothetical protein